LLIFASECLNLVLELLNDNSGASQFSGESLVLRQRSLKSAVRLLGTTLQVDVEVVGLLQAVAKVRHVRLRLRTSANYSKTENQTGQCFETISVRQRTNVVGAICFMLKLAE